MSANPAKAMVRIVTKPKRSTQRMLHGLATSHTPDPSRDGKRSTRMW